MDAERLQQIQERWANLPCERWHHVSVVEEVGDYQNPRIHHCVGPYEDDSADAILWTDANVAEDGAANLMEAVARARQDVPDLLAEVAAANQRIAELERAIRNHREGRLGDRLLPNCNGWDRRLWEQLGGVRQ